MIEDKIVELLNVKFSEEDFNDCYVVRVVQNNNKVEAFIDSDSDLDLRKCQKISRYLESIIDEKGWLGVKYTLEVSSPGATAPLVPRQYQKHLGRKVAVIVQDDTAYEGKLEKIEDDQISISYVEITRDRKKKIKTDIVKVIDFDDIKEIKVIISFK